MKFRKYFGAIMVFLTAVIATSGSASTFSVGVEEMPESMKKNR